MKIKNLQITSSTIDLEFDIRKPICFLCGRYADLVLDLVRELIGDYSSENDPDRIDDGCFVIHSDIEMDGKNYNVCYIRNADFMGDNRIAANFIPNSFDCSKDDTVEFLDKCKERNNDPSNILCGSIADLNREDDRPIFIYNVKKSTASELESLANSGRQVFVVCTSSVLDIDCESVQICFADIA
jgi:hypothetical protein